MGIYDHETTDQRAADLDALDLYATIARDLLEMARVLDDMADDADIQRRMDDLGGGDK